MCFDLTKELTDGGCHVIDLSSGALIKELIGKTCRCGKKKIARQTFCRQCYFQLPNDLRRRLYDRMGDGYEIAYAQAVKLLGIDTPPPTK